MKTYTNLYSKLCTFDNFKFAYEKAKKRKYNKSYVQEFEKNWRYNLCILLEKLKNKTYEPKPLRKFILRDPKTRTICVSYFEDRIVHHILINILEQIFEQLFIYDSYASRKCKGMLLAVKRFDYFMRKVSKNGSLVKNPRNNNEVKGYLLKADISKYFENVNHEILIKIIETKVKDKDVIWLIRKILNNSDTEGVGMPLGNWTSQFFANVYLNELDQFVKNKLKVKCYIRYVDDFVILDENKDKLKIYKKQIEEFLGEHLKLTLHPDKTKILPLSKGTTFLGFRIFYNYKLPTRKNIMKINQRLEELAVEYKRDSDYHTKITKTIRGWNGYACHANTHNLMDSMVKKYVKEVIV